MSHSTSAEGHVRRHEHSVIETLQSLIVAFVLAMTFRGFVTEGFVIPTGSMAPTLYGKHLKLHAPFTGYDFAVGYDARLRRVDLTSVADPMLGPQYAGSGAGKPYARPRMGDRILVLKSLYPFSSPDRFDVVVFKNPTNPNGEDGNYIKRLIGLPGEAIWLVDGDVFAAPAATPRDHDAFVIQRKPEHVQRAVWQPVWRSERVPLRPDRIDRPPYYGPPWLGSEWDVSGPTFTCDTADPTMLEWDNHIRQLDDWAPYNMLLTRGRLPKYVSDVRVAGTVVPESDGLAMTFRLEVQGHRMEFVIADGAAQIRMRSTAYGDDFPDEGWTGSALVPVAPMPGGAPTNVEFWHVDQRLSLFIDGERVVDHAYAWAPPERLRHATNQSGEPEMLATRSPAAPPKLEWRFSGTPLSLDRIEVDRDLFYRADTLDRSALRNPTNPGFEDQVAIQQYAAATHPENLAILGPDHFFMAGDNSSASSDSRLWGNPHPIVAQQIDPSPFVVHRKLMLGKAWVVYFPAPHSIRDEGKAVIPDFGRLRFVR